VPFGEATYFHASGAIDPIVHFDGGGGTMHVRGLFLGDVNLVIGPLQLIEQIPNGSSVQFEESPAAHHQREMFTNLRNFSESLAVENDDVFWRTLCLDGDWTGENPKFPAPEVFGVQRKVAFGQGPVPDNFMPGQPLDFRYRNFVHAFSRSLEVGLSNRTFFTTVEGHMGIGPFGARQSDLAVILFGSPHCHIIRPYEEGSYQLLGDAYIYGCMEGQRVTNLGQTDGQDFQLR
jgi:hypothetical protein